MYERTTSGSRPKGTNISKPLNSLKYGELRIWSCLCHDVVMRVITDLFGIVCSVHVSKYKINVKKSAEIRYCTTLHDTLIL